MYLSAFVKEIYNIYLLPTVPTISILYLNEELSVFSGILPALSDITLNDISNIVLPYIPLVYINKELPLAMFTSGIKTLFLGKIKLKSILNQSLILLDLHPSTREEYYRRLFSEAKFYIFADVQFSTIILAILCFIIVIYFIKMVRNGSKSKPNEFKNLPDSCKHFSKKS